MPPVRVRVVMGDGLELDATVDSENSWIVSSDGLPTGNPEFVREQEELLELHARIGANRLGYVPNPPNRFAHAILDRFPGSRILGGAPPRTRAGLVIDEFLQSHKARGSTGPI